MGWNNRIQRKEFEKRQMVLAEQYRSLGMTEEQIKMMYEFDLDLYRSARIFYTHNQPLEINFDVEDVGVVTNYLLDCQTEDFRNYSNRYWWIDELEILYSAVKKLSEDEKELITLYVFDGHTEEEIASIRKCTHQAISYQLIKIKKKLLSAQGGK